ncbi:hypothetical protein ABKN59_010570 [Abortiporus biennis]
MRLLIFLVVLVRSGGWCLYTSTSHPPASEEYFLTKILLSIFNGGHKLSGLLQCSFYWPFFQTLSTFNLNALLTRVIYVKSDGVVNAMIGDTKIISNVFSR